MNSTNFNKIKPILSHFLFWILVWFFFRFFFEYSTSNSVYGFWFSSLLLPITVGITYVINLFLIPNFLLQKKYKRFVLYSFYTFIISADFIGLVIVYYFLYLSGLNISAMPFMSRQFVFVLVLVYLVAGLVSFVNLLSHNFRTVSKYKELQNKILQTQLQLKEQELRFLKMQIHPHFLFNALNTIYGFALKKRDETPEMILKLSNLLDYILYQIEKPQVLVIDEINHLLDYISLEEMRFHDTLNVETNIEVSNNSIQIAPMLLIPFVENAFKHGDIINGSLNVTIHIKTENDVLFFEIENTSLNKNKTNSGIGLENIAKRLQMLYNNSYSFETTHTANTFKVKLAISNLNKFKNE